VDTATVTLFFALLATLAQIVAVVAVLAWVLGKVVPSVERGRRSVLAQVGPQCLAMAAVVALVCTLGSLYLSEVAHFPPCKLCWYQRIAMYPQVVVLGIAALRRDLGARLACIVLSVMGGAVSIYHALLEDHPNWSTSSSCDPANPCSIKWVEKFGYLTIPRMALSGFVLIIVLLAAAGTRPDPQEIP
jgi:disulfide bond formation protein DsbB